MEATQTHSHPVIGMATAVLLAVVSELSTYVKVNGAEWELIMDLFQIFAWTGAGTIGFISSVIAGVNWLQKNGWIDLKKKKQ